MSTTTLNTTRRYQGLSDVRDMDFQSIIAQFLYHADGQEHGYVEMETVNGLLQFSYTQEFTETGEHPYGEMTSKFTSVEVLYSVDDLDASCVICNFIENYLLNL
jgi:hypothetical protein